MFSSVVFCVLLAVTTLTPPCEGFSPNYLASLAALSPGSMDHKEITEMAALTVLRDYLLDNANSLVDSTNVINSLPQDASARDLFAAYYHGETSCGLRLRCSLVAFRFSRAIDVIQDANAFTDIAESDRLEAHFDSEMIPEGNNRLLEKRGIVISHIGGGLYKEARREVGRALHTLQDFYSHSNWVELGNTEPWNVLGIPGRTLTNLADESVKTCIDCERGDDVNDIIDFFGPLVSLTEAKREYNCLDNIDEDLERQRLITSGYVSHGPMETKPAGKCSHGGIIDGTSDLSPEGGINKDLKTNTFSPHYNLHDRAASVAVQATVLFFEDIREEVGDVAFADLFDIEDLRTSLAFIVDTTDSLREELPQIQAFLPRIGRELADYSASSVGGSVNVDFLLVPYNDPDSGTVQKTDSIATLIDYLGALTTSGGGDCAEPSIGALIRAAENSQSQGVLNLYTDAPASDEQRLTELQFILRDRDLVLNVFELTGPGSCNQRKRSVRRKKRQSQNTDTYEFLTIISGGHKLEVVPADLADVDLIIFSSFRPSSSLVYQEVGMSSGFEVRQVELSVDSTVTEFQIIVNGNNLQSLSLLTPQGGDGRVLPNTIESISSSSLYLATVNVSESSLYGSWQLTFNSSNSYRIYFSVDSSLQLLYTLYRGDNTSRTSLAEVRDKPLQGERLVLSVVLDEDIEMVNLTTASILSPDGSVLSNHVLNYTEDGNYYAIFEAPTSLFQILIAGVNSQGNGFTRIDRTGVDPTDVKVAVGAGQSPIQVLRSQETVTLDVTLNNFGAFASFTVDVISSIASSGFTYSIGSPPATSQIIQLDGNSMVTLSLEITADSGVSETNFLSLVVSVYDPNNPRRSNYLNVEVEGSSFSSAQRLHGAVGTMVTLFVLLLAMCN